MTTKQNIKDTAVMNPDDYSQFTEVSWQPKNGITWEQWVEAGSTLQQIHKSVRWWIGDWLNFGDSKFGEKYAQAVDELGISRDSLIDYAYVARSVPANLRNPLLSWSCHKAVAPDYLNLDDKEHWLNTAVREGWDTRRLRYEIKQSRIIDLTGQSAIPDGANGQSSASASGDLVVGGEWKENDEDYSEAAPFDMRAVDPVVKLRVALADLIIAFVQETKKDDHPAVKAARAIIKQFSSAVVIEGAVTDEEE